MLADRCTQTHTETNRHTYTHITVLLCPTGSGVIKPAGHDQVSDPPPPLWLNVLYEPPECDQTLIS